MACLVDGNGAFLFVGEYLGAFFKSADYTVDSGVEVVFVDRLLVVASGD